MNFMYVSIVLKEEAWPITKIYTMVRIDVITLIMCYKKKRERDSLVELLIV